MLARGKEIAWWPEFMRVRYENWVNGLQGDWNITRQRFFGVPVPGLVPDRRGRRRRLPLADPGRRGQPARRPDHRPRARLRRRPARQARRVHGRPRRHGHLGHVVADAADRHRVGRRPRPVRPHVPDGPAAPGARHHPHLALLHGRPLALRARRHAVGQRRHLGLHRRPRPQEAVEVGGQRARRPRRADRDATAPTACATGPPTAARAWTSCSTRASSRSAASWPSSCSTRRSSRSGLESTTAGRGHRAARPVDAGRAGRPRRRGHRPPSTATTTPGPSSAPRASSGRSATTTSSW